MFEYETVSAEQAFLSSTQNYSLLRGQSTNLYRCFLPQGWYLNNKDGVSSYVHPDGVFDDPNGKELRVELYRRLRSHYSFRNEKLLFDISHSRIFSLNVYGSKQRAPHFDFIGNLFDPMTIDMCYEHEDQKEKIPLLQLDFDKMEMKDAVNEFKKYEYYHRILKVYNYKLNHLHKYSLFPLNLLKI